MGAATINTSLSEAALTTGAPQLAQKRDCARSGPAHCRQSNAMIDQVPTAPPA
jgi:hypothetical protein